MSTVAVKVPTILRTYTNGDSEVSVPVEDGATLGDVVKALDAAYPGIAARILDDAGKVRRFVNVYVNDDDVRFADGLGTSTPAGTRVSVIPAVAGGRR